jgi:hypothetical protein
MEFSAVSWQTRTLAVTPYDGQLDADLAFAQQLQDSIDQRDAVVYSKRKVQMQEDAEYAKSLDEEPVNKTTTRASKQQQQMATVNDTVHLQTMLERVTLLQFIQDNEEGDDDQPMELAQLEQLEEIIHGQPYVPDHYEDNIYFHGSEPQGSPAKAHNEDSE